MELRFRGAFGPAKQLPLERKFPRGTTNQKHYQDPGSSRHQYGISALVTQTSFWWGSSGDLAKRPLFSQATKRPETFKFPDDVPHGSINVLTKGTTFQVSPPRKCFLFDDNFNFGGLAKEQLL